MTNAELVAFAKEHPYLSILEQEFVKRMEREVAHDRRYRAIGKDVQSIVQWARDRMENGR
jgi:hypothetical protein